MSLNGKNTQNSAAAADAKATSGFEPDAPFYSPPAFADPPPDDKPVQRAPAADGVSLAVALATAVDDAVAARDEAHRRAARWQTLASASGFVHAALAASHAALVHYAQDSAAVGILIDSAAGWAVWAIHASAAVIVGALWAKAWRARRGVRRFGGARRDTRGARRG